MYDLTKETDREKLVARIEADVEAYCKEKFAEGRRTHLGGSEIGGECMAEIWFNFRWVLEEQLAGHMLRLLNRGHKEEPRFVEWLEGIGFEVHETDPDTGKQYRISGCKGHFGGSLDSILKPPAHYGLPEDYCVWLGEFKTYNETSFTKLAGKKPAWSQFKLGGKHAKRIKGDGVKKTKPQHYAQMSSYGRAYGFRFGLYCAVNKNTDELYYEIVELDWRLADDGFRKADNIINAQSVPQRVSLTETYSYCKNLCKFVDICHRGVKPEKNCRSCVNASAAENGEWHCGIYNNNIPKDFIPKGCDEWQPIING
jgi:hypothetical protein